MALTKACTIFKEIGDTAKVHGTISNRKFKNYFSYFVSELETGKCCVE